MTNTIIYVRYEIKYNDGNSSRDFISPFIKTRYLPRLHEIIQSDFFNVRTTIETNKFKVIGILNKYDDVLYDIDYIEIQLEPLF